MNPGFGENARIPVGAFGLAAFAVFGVVFELLLIEEQLFGRCKDEIRPTIYALENAICKLLVRRSHHCHILDDR